MSPAEGVGDGPIEFHIIPSPSPPPSPPPLPPPHILILGGSDQQSVFWHIRDSVANYLNKYLKRNYF